MNNYIEQIINARPGSFLGITVKRRCKTLKGVAAQIEKVSELVVRSGVEYDNLSAVEAKREDGRLPSENQGLPWGKWKQYPYLIEHNGVEYTRLALVKGNRPTVKFYVDGKEVNKSDIESLLLSSEKQENDTMPDIVTVKSENISHVRLKA